MSQLAELSATVVLYPSSETGVSSLANDIYVNCHDNLTPCFVVVLFLSHTSGQSFEERTRSFSPPVFKK